MFSAVEVELLMGLVFIVGMMYICWNTCRYEKLGAVNLAAAAKGRGRTKMYRVDQPARLRNGFELDSELVGRLEPGDVLRVLEERQNVNGPPNGTALCCRHTADSGEFWHQG